jgi:hypothetical protein
MKVADSGTFAGAPVPSTPKHGNNFSYISNRIARRAENTSPG